MIPIVIHMKLVIKNLSKTYKNGVKAIDHLNLEIGTGMFGLLGPNGAGKSTLMRTIATLQSPDSGSIMFGEINVLEDKISLRKNLGICRNHLAYIQTCQLRICWIILRP